MSQVLPKHIPLPPPPFIKSTSEEIKIEIDYHWICQRLLKLCKRTEDGLITDESLIQACMELCNEQDKK